MADTNKIAAELRELCSRRATGHYAIVSDTGPRATVTLNRGEVMAISYHALAGRRALEGLMTVRLRGAKTKFTDTLPGTGTRDANLPSTAEVLDILSGDATPYDSKPAVKIAEASEAELKLIRKILIDHLGPIGNMILDDCLRQRNRADTMDGLLLNVAEEVPAQIREKFVAAIREGLATLPRRHRAP